MAITPKLEIRQSQSLLMTPQLRQAINILQMSNIELNEFVEQELETNPLLEREDDKVSQFEDNDQTIDDYDKTDTPEPDNSLDIDYDNQFDDYGSDCEGYDTSSDYSWQDYSSSKNTANEDFDFFEKRLSDKKSLHVLLSEQISLKFTSDKDKIIAFSLTEHLDESGYFRGNLKEISQKIGTSVSYIKKILEQLKGFEPSGVFAENLADCLKIQLKDLNRFDPAIEKLLQNLELLGKREFKALKKICEVEDEDLLDMINDIKSLNPKPTADYLVENISYIIPDVFVRTNKHGVYRVELNNQTLPRVLINQRYYTEIKDINNKEANKYLRTQIGSANFLVKALHQRATSILRVSEEIIKAQRDFLEKGIEHLKPMLLRDIAEAVEMHESSISRITTNKYMHTPRGIFELKYFFSSAANTYNGDENTSTLSIKHKIKKLIEDETPENILSDDKLVEELAKQSIKIARRTITKYRESMNIPTSAERKRSKRNIA